MAAAVVFQCTACRSLGSAVDVVVAADGTRAGLVCPSCRFSSWLPVSGHVGDVHGEASVVVDPARGLPASSSSSEALALTRPMTATAATTTVPPPEPLALVPMSTPNSMPTPASEPSTALSSGLKEAERVRERYREQAPTDQQRDLAERFENLLNRGWAYETEHKTLLKAAALVGELAFVGGRYRAVLDVVRDEPRAKAAQAELLTLAMATMQQSKDLGSPGEAPGSGRRNLAIGVLIVAVLVGGAFFVRTLLRTVAQVESIDR